MRSVVNEAATPNMSTEATGNPRPRHAVGIAGTHPRSRDVVPSPGRARRIRRKRTGDTIRGRRVEMQRGVVFRGRTGPGVAFVDVTTAAIEATGTGERPGVIVAAGAGTEVHAVGHGRNRQSGRSDECNRCEKSLDLHLISPL